MKSFLRLTTKDNLKNYMRQVAFSMDKETVLNVNNLYQTFLSTRDTNATFKPILQYIFSAIYNEDIPYTIFKNYSLSDLDDYYTKIINLWELYKKSGNIIKSKKIRELYNMKVYYNINNKISYKDLENVENEITRILNNDEITFLSNIIGSNEINAITSELLNLNEVEPKMITSKRIILYSAFLNFTDIYNEDLLELIINLSGINNTVVELTIENWSDKAKLFNNILEKINKQFLHY